MNGENSRQSLISKERLLDFANSGNGALRKFNNHTISESVSAKV